MLCNKLLLFINLSGVHVQTQTIIHLFIGFSIQNQSKSFILGYPPLFDVHQMV